MLEGLGLVDVIGTASGETLVGGNEQITWGGAGNDRLEASSFANNYFNFLLGGTGNDTYNI